MLDILRFLGNLFYFFFFVFIYEQPWSITINNINYAAINY